jgi:predicted histidine transporter YuiF (NhaC family)
MSGSDGSAPPNLVATAGMLTGVVAALVIAYRCERAYRRWLRQIDPLAEARARLDRTRSGFRAGRANVSEVAGLIADVLTEVERARSIGA